jgi:hypothetical protein
MWSSPIDFTLMPTEMSDSFKFMGEHHTGLPMGEHVGAFGTVRRHHVHEGIDLYCPQGTVVHAVETGIVVAVLDFTGPKAGSPWWRDTKSVLIEGESGVVGYGEISTYLEEGWIIRVGDTVGVVEQVLTKDKGRPMSMLHLELYVPGTRDVVEWKVGEERPQELCDPTPHLLEMLASS